MMKATLSRRGMLCRRMIPDQQETRMSDHTYKLVEIVGSSPDSSDQAIRNALAKAGETIKHIDWFEVVETRGHVQDGKVGHFQVTLKIGFRVN
jgi:dodecin